jgi:hypothetical protein
MNTSADARNFAKYFCRLTGIKADVNLAAVWFVQSSSDADEFTRFCSRLRKYTSDNDN